MIELINDYFIEVDQYSYTVKKRCKGVSKKTNEPIITEKIIGYYGDLAQAVRGAKNHMQRENLSNGIFTLDEALYIINEIAIKFDELFKD